ncbi:MAG: RagB/SusD family nutrient uptake outer membrane protein [Lachnospiraceae bacterium]|nr:RagB/SusD family nutrient uptake outer membrane protein [Lachnospiraceae bacterium]
MKKNILILSLFLIPCSLFLTGCKDYLTELAPGVTTADSYFGSGQAAIMNVNGCYVPLMWEYNYTYYSEWFIGDVVGDDALKGGQNTNDMSAVYDMENWKTDINNPLLLDYYRAQYQGIARCNMALANIPSMPITDTVMTEDVQKRLIGEVSFLRAYYYFRLLRVFGGVPLVTKVMNNSAEWRVPRASVEQMFTQICSDLEVAQQNLWRKDMYKERTTTKNAQPDLGRATKGAAEAMLQKVHLYMASPYWATYLSSSPSENYEEAKRWGDSIMKNDSYTLCDKYVDNFTLAGENGPESVFEIQYMEHPEGDYGGANGEGGNGYTAGTFTPILIRSRNDEIGGGWGFNHPTHSLYNEFEEADSIRRDVAIYNPKSFKKPGEEVYLGSPYLNAKYAMYLEFPKDWPKHASRGDINSKQIRYADVLLMQAEALIGLGKDGEAMDLIRQVRHRAGLDEYKEVIKVNGVPVDAPTAWDYLRHERRMELAMEGHRWFDLVRWYGSKDGGGELEKLMNKTYKDLESADAQMHMNEFVGGKHELFPIPADEIKLYPMEQNPYY